MWFKRYFCGTSKIRFACIIWQLLLSLGAFCWRIHQFKKNVKKRIAIFASGSGSNAQKIMEHFKYDDQAEVALVLSNSPDAYVLQRADNFEVPTHVFDRYALYQTDEVVDLLVKLQIDLVVLAGFLWLVPQNLLNKYPNKII